MQPCKLKGFFLFREVLINHFKAIFRIAFFHFSEINKSWFWFFQFFSVFFFNFSYAGLSLELEIWRLKVVTDLISLLMFRLLFKQKADWQFGMSRTLKKNGMVCAQISIFGLNSLHNLRGQNWLCLCYQSRYLQQIHWSKLLCGMYGFTAKWSIPTLNICQILMRFRNVITNQKNWKKNFFLKNLKIMICLFHRNGKTLFWKWP